MSNSNRSMATQGQKPTFASFLKGNIAQIQAALPKHMTADRMIRVALTTYNKTPDLQKCDMKTVAAQVMECAQLGLEPDGILGSAYLIPFRNNQAGRYDCQLIIGYKGLIELAYRSGKVSLIKAVPIYENENFDWDGLHVTGHKPMPPSKRGKEIVAVYAVAVMTDGNKQYEFMWTEEIKEIEGSSKAGSKSPWKTHWLEMAKKTTIRRMAKTLPLSPEFVKAAAIDEYQEAGIATAPTEVFSAEEEPVAITDTVQPAGQDNDQQAPPPEDDVPPPEDDVPPPPGEETPADQQSQNEGEQTVQAQFLEELWTFVEGDEAQAEKLCREFTEYRGKSLHPKSIPTANDRRVGVALSKLRDHIKEQKEWNG